MNPWETYYTSDHPLFRVGGVSVYVTTLFVALQAIALVILAIVGLDPLVVSQLVFGTEALTSGKLWTLFTYVFFDSLSFWTALGLVFFYLFGRPVESRLGTHRYLRLLAVLILGPSVLLSLIILLFGSSVGYSSPAPGLGGPMGYWSATNVRLSVLIAFVWFHSDAVFWPGVKAKWFGVFFVALQTLQFLAARQWVFFWMCWFSLLLAYVCLRRMGMTSRFPSLEEPLLAALPKRRPPGYRSSKRKLKVVKPPKTGSRKHRYESKLAPKIEAPSSKTAAASVDHLLEKISRQGISSLTPEERRQLENASNQLSDRENPFTK